MTIREPILHPVRISELRPTQMTVGLREVEAKRRLWREKHGVHAQEFLGKHMIPVLKGPKERFYVLDHHHLVRALHEEGVEEVLVNVVSDLSSLTRQSFWTVCEHRAWTHPYDTEGLRRSVDDIPKRVSDLKDDPYRSLAGELRRAGGFAKDVTPFSEFLWADFLRRRISRKRVVSAFEAAVVKALDLARSQEASYLPGWCGPIEN
ncbi:ParB-like protein [Bosea vaviloviae]|uniref:Chromosome partitioning protein ParB n=1 Tax=Bosea vaviloviae TaxID=1526658 RepID=A0A1D7UB21_9HYPH|nr:ParB-like protein [Bosea vaviloviae]AOO84566.1 chromosome partitioning protein ParB [Bosea vaviloviae]